MEFLYYLLLENQNDKIGKIKMIFLFRFIIIDARIPNILRYIILLKYADVPFINRKYNKKIRRKKLLLFDPIQ